MYITPWDTINVLCMMRSSNTNSEHIMRRRTVVQYKEIKKNISREKKKPI